MTDRFHSLTVVLEKDIREDDAAALMDAISQFRGVLSVAGDVADITTHLATERARHELEEKLFAALRSE